MRQKASAAVSDGGTGCRPRRLRHPGRHPKVERAARSAGSEVEDIGSSFRDAERDAGRAARGIEDDLKDLKDSVDDVSSAISLGFGADMLVDLAGG